MKEEALSQLNEPDKAFALEIHKRYKLPLEDLCHIIEVVRLNLALDLEELKKDSAYYQVLDTLNDPDIEVSSVNLVTNKGTIIIESSDPLFAYLEIPIKRIRDKFNSEVSYLDEAMNKGAKAASSEWVMKYVSSTSLIARHKEILAFDFIHHFKFHWDSKPTMTEEEWNANPTEANGYDEYRRDIGKSRLKSVNGRFDPNFFNLRQGF